MTIKTLKSVNLEKFTNKKGDPLTDEDLRAYLNEALLKEDYLTAINIRDEIKRRKTTQNKPLKKRGFNRLLSIFVKTT